MNEELATPEEIDAAIKASIGYERQRAWNEFAAARRDLWRVLSEQPGPVRLAVWLTVRLQSLLDMMRRT